MINKLIMIKKIEIEKHDFESNGIEEITKIELCIAGVQVKKIDKSIN